MFKLFTLLLIFVNYLHANPNYTNEEKTWIKNNSIVIVGGEMDWAPFDFVNVHNKYDGITNDYLELISQKSGLKFDVKTGYTWNELVENYKRNKFDILPAVYYSKSRENIGNYSAQYYTVRDYLFIKESTNIKSMEDLNGKVLAIVKGYTTIAKVKSKYPKIKILETRSIVDSIASVVSGEADATLEVHAVMSYTIKTNAIEGIKVVSQEGLGTSPLHMLVQKDKNILLSILNKTIIDIDQNDQKEIASKWLSSTDTNGIISLQEAIITVSIFFLIVLLLLYKQYLQKQANIKIEKQKKEQQVLLSLFDYGDSVLFKWNNDENWTIDYVSSNVTNLLGYSQEEFLSTKIAYSNCIHEEDISKVIEEVEQGKKSNDDFLKHESYRIIAKDGKEKWVLDYTVMQKGEKGNITHFIGYIIDITEHENTIKNLEKFIDTQSNIVLVTTGDQITFANQTFFEFFGFHDLESFQINHKSISEFFIENDRFFHLGKIDNTENWIDTMKRLPHSQRIISMIGSSFKIHAFSVAINQFDKDLQIVSFTDISQTIENHIRLQDKSILDKLTGAFNREYFEQNYKQLITEYETENTHLAIALLDIDHFKIVNDTYGHDIGDIVLKQFNNILEKMIY